MHNTRLGKWSQKGVPHKGWKCVDCHDLGQPSQICEMCEQMEIRYVHVMEHKDYPKPLEVGTVCAENMEADRLKPKEREKNLVNQARRRSNWLKRDWRTSKNGNPYLNTDGFNIVIFKSGSGFKVRIRHGKSGKEKGKNKTFKTEDEAKLKAFDAMIKWKKSLSEQENSN